MENNNLLNVRELHNSDISLKSIKNFETTIVKPSCFGYFNFPYRRNYFVFIVSSDGSIIFRHKVYCNPFIAVLVARFYKKRYRYLSDFHVEIVHYDLQRCRHISYCSGHGEPVEDIELTF